MNRYHSLQQHLESCLQARSFQHVLWSPADALLLLERQSGAQQETRSTIDGVVCRSGCCVHHPHGPPLPKRLWLRQSLERDYGLATSVGRHASMQDRRQEGAQAPPYLCSSGESKGQSRQTQNYLQNLAQKCFSTSHSCPINQTQPSNSLSLSLGDTPTSIPILTIQVCRSWRLSLVPSLRRPCPCWQDATP